jgi:hypothetical protein
MTDKPLVDPFCLCGRLHPCELHGAWVDEPIKPQHLGPRFPEHMTVAERTDIDRRNWVLAKDMAGIGRTKKKQQRKDEAGAA